MFKIGVILNEIEMQRYGHANFLAKIKGIFPSSYLFISFTSVNINELFENEGRLLFDLDSLFISTNSCNDIYVNKILMTHSEQIYDFLARNKGLYWGYQKKNANLKTRVLPQLYEFCSKQDDDKVSSDGVIEIKKNYQNDALLLYPRNVEQEHINLQCKNNSFRHHVYRAYIIPDNEGAYYPLLVDNTYAEERILLARAVSSSIERLVVSTIIIDWEEQEDLLVNIISYITEGIPYLAFIGTVEANSEFSFLISNATLSKIAFSSWENTLLIPKSFQNLYNIYIFSPEIEESEIDIFWNQIKYNKKNLKIYSLKSIDHGEELVMKQYSNYSSVDLIKDSIELWLTTKFEIGHMWNRSFWISFDTLIMMRQTGMKYDIYLDDIFSDIKVNHLKDGRSYDGLIGCTVGLYQLLYYFKPNGFQIQMTWDWIVNKLDDISIFEKQSFLIMCWKLKLVKDFNSSLKQRYIVMLNEVYESIRTNDYITEIDECRRIEICLMKEISPEFYIKMLLENQDESGKWVNVSRTAYVIIILLTNYYSIKSISRQYIVDITYSIERAIMFLRSNFNEEKGNCNNDMLSTVRFMYAYDIYNKVLGHSTTDFFETIKANEINTDYTEIMSNSVYKISELFNMISSQKEHEKQLLREISELKSTQNEIKKKKIKANARFRILFIFFVFISTMFVMLVGYIIFNTNELPNILHEIGSITNIVVAFFISLFLEGLLEKATKRKD